MRLSWRSRLRQVTVAGAVAAVGSIAVVSVVQAARSAGTSATRPAAAEQYPRKVTICHRTGSRKNPFVTITVSRNALPAHLRHGDTIGPCSSQRFTICHKTKAGKKRTAKVRFRALRAHMRHGDRIGRCKVKKSRASKGQGRKAPKRPRSPKPPKRR